MLLATVNSAGAVLTRRYTSSKHIQMVTPTLRRLSLGDFIGYQRHTQGFVIA